LDEEIEDFHKIQRETERIEIATNLVQGDMLLNDNGVGTLLLSTSIIKTIKKILMQKHFSHCLGICRARIPFSYSGVEV
jgi:hypothetical protein